MVFEVDDVEHAGAPMPGVSGTVVRALMDLVRAQVGDAGVAHALALAAEERSPADVGDTFRWTSLDDAVALFAAAAHVTGDRAIALHVGEELLWTADEDLARRIRLLDSAEDAFRHVGALVDRFEGATDAVALEVEPGRALVEVAPVGSEVRHAYLCELTRGLLAELPVLFDAAAATVTEHECAARGGRACRYDVRWNVVGRAGRVHRAADPTRPDGLTWRDDDVLPPADGPTVRTVAEADLGSSGGYDRYEHFDPHDRHDQTNGNGNGNRWNGGGPVRTPSATAAATDPSAEIEALGEQLAAAREALVEAVADAARWEAAATRGQAGRAEEAARGQHEAEVAAAQATREVSRLEQLLEETAAAALDFLELDIDGLLTELASRADRVVPSDRFLLMVQAAPGLPIELHHRGIGADEARTLAADLWNAGAPDDPGCRVLDIASPRRQYGRLAVFVDPADGHPAADDRALRLFADYAANVLDVFTVLSDVRRSDSTARTILSFSGQLSGLTNLAQALQILADTVPEVSGCTQSTVYLWDKENSRLVLGAYTTGMTPPDADLGPITPHWAAAAGASGVPAPRADRRADEQDADGTRSSRDPVSVEVDNPLVQRMIASREVMVLDASTVGDPLLRRLMEESGVPASVVAPLFASGEFLGVIAANFSKDAAPGIIHDADLHERLSGLADQASTAIQNLELLEKVSHMAWHDALTGLPNRRLFEDRVEQELVRSRRVGEPVCMFFVDLDNFKSVNDTYGHAVGDQLILQVGQRLVDTVRSQDTVARVGGDEFAILLPGLVDQQSINQLAERTLEAMHTPFEIFSEEVTTSASVGIAIAPEHGDTYDDLLNRADEAMYRAKGHGRDAFEMFRSTPDPVHPGRRALDDRQLHADLIKALDGNEFFLVYQPYIDLRTAAIVGVEALIRWRHPTLGVLDPPQFIPMAERSDLIVALDNWVLWQACRQLRSWRDHGMDPLRLSVNLASRDLSNPEFFDSVERTLSDTGTDPSLLELEITERVVLDTNGPAVGNIDRLRKLGVRFTIDDFGSGNSSLDRIGSFPVSTLKIDRSFVQVLGPEDEENSLVGAIIALAARLGLSCVAEGVETLLQSRVLLQRGCTTAQGYYFSPPLPPEGIEAMLSAPTPAEVPEYFGEPPTSRPEGLDSDE